MKHIFKIIKVNIYFLFIVSIQAENFLAVFPNEPTPTLTLMLTQNDKDFIEEMQKYPKNTAFFIDGKTEKIISTNILLFPPKSPITQQIPTNTVQEVNTSPKIKKLQKPTPQIPYQMQEEKIDLLR